MHNFKFTSLIAVSLSAVIVFPVTAKDPERIDLGDLYEQYENNNYSSMSMPQFRQDILISGEVIGMSKGITGKSILFAGSQDYDGELARLSPMDEDEAKKMSRLQEGQPFQAACSLGMTMGSDWMSLQECVFN